MLGDSYVAVLAAVAGYTDAGALSQVRNLACMCGDNVLVKILNILGGLLYSHATYLFVAAYLLFLEDVEPFTACSLLNQFTRYLIILQLFHTYYIFVYLRC